MAAPIQLGTEIKIGFGNYALTGYVLDSLEIESTGETKTIKNQDNETMTVLVSDRGQRIKLTAIILGTGSADPKAIGSTMTIGNATYRVESSSIKHGREETILEATVVKENSMSYS